LKATAVSLLPSGIFYLVASRREFATLWPLFIGGSAGFVGAATLVRVCCEIRSPSVVEVTPLGRLGPEGVLAQAEARERLNDLMMSYWRREQS
jgi:hypothetical protein